MNGNQERPIAPIFQREKTLNEGTNGGGLKLFQATSVARMPPHVPLSAVS